MNHTLARLPKTRLSWILLAGGLLIGATALGLTLLAVRTPRSAHDDIEARLARLEDAGAGAMGRADRVPRLNTAAVRSDNLSTLLERVAALELQVAALRDERPGGTPWKELVASPNPDLRRQSVRRLRDLAKTDPEARRALAGLLRDGDPKVRREAVGALRRGGDASWLGDVLPLLTDAEGEVRGQAARTAGDLARQSDDPADRTRAAQALQGLIADGESDVRRDAVRALSDVGGKETVPALTRALSDTNFEVQERAIEGLGESGDVTAVASLQRVYGDGSGPNALRTAVALKRLGDPTAFSKEAARLRGLVEREGSSDERRQALALLGEHAPVESRAILEKALRDPSERIRREAQRALDRSRR